MPKPTPEKVSGCSLDHERRLRRAGYSVIAGTDEAGRGPLAGPVVAAAVILPESYAHPILTDSKKLTAKRRELLAAEILSDGDIISATAIVSVADIESLNILRASGLAMERAVAALGVSVDMVLVDGLAVRGFPFPQEPLVKGDALSLSIAAASVLAKVERDRLMVEYAEEFPEYGFEKHKGYGTRQHLDALHAHGPCPIHRKTFQPVAQLTLDLPS